MNFIMKNNVAVFKFDLKTENKFNIKTLKQNTSNAFTDLSKISVICACLLYPKDYFIPNN